MNPQERASQFLRCLVRQPKVAVNVHGTGKSRFARALKVFVPTLLASAAAAYAASVVPKVEMHIQGDAPVILQSVGEQVNAAFSEQAVKPQEVGTIARCLYDNVLMQQADNPEFEPTVQLMVHLMDASVEINRDIEHWASENRRDPAQAVAALCENPENWQGQLQVWDKAARDGEHATVFRKLAMERAYAEFGAKVSTVYWAAEDMASVQAFKVSGNNQRFIDAVGSLAGGAASLFGGRQSERTVKNVASSLKSGERHMSNGRWVDMGNALGQGAAKLLGDRDAERSIRNTASNLKKAEQRIKQGQRIQNSKDTYDTVRGIGNLMSGIGSDASSYTRQREAEQARRDREREREIQRQQRNQRYR